MSMPIRTTVEDIITLCTYLAAKPIGATVAEAKAVIDPGVLDGRKINGMKFWGLIDDVEGKMKLSELGRALVKDRATNKADILRKVIRAVPPYRAIIERAFYRKESVIAASEAAAHWHNNFKSEVSENEKILNDQAVCFFQVAQGADLGQLTIGRHSQPTRFEFHEANLAAFIEGKPDAHDVVTEKKLESSALFEEKKIIELHAPMIPPLITSGLANNRVFITHGKNTKILTQVKEIVTYGGFEPIVAIERESGAKPVPEKVMADMRTCAAAVIHVAVDAILFDREGGEQPQINGNVLIEIGAAMALYPGYKFILLVEEGLKLPSNLQGLYECRYTGSELSSGATMKLLKAFNEFKAAA